MEIINKLQDTVSSLANLATTQAQAATDAISSSLASVTVTAVPDDEKPCLDGRKVPRVHKPLDLSKYKGYELSNLEESKSGFKATLKLVGDAVNAYGEDIASLIIEVEHQTETRLHVHIYDTSLTQFQIPEHVFPRPPNTSTPSSSSELIFNHTSSPFGFWITRRSSPSSILFDTRSTTSPLVFSDQFLHLSTSIPASTSIYGPGEIISPSGFQRDSSGAGASTTLWNRDCGTPVNENLYGAHPFYMETRYPTDTASATPSQSHGIFLLNSHGMTIAQSPHSMTYSLLGGTFDFYIISGPSQKDVIRQYSEIVGLPARQPFWAFGLHMCRWQGEWKTPEGVRGIVEKMREAGVPLETVWSDLDYMRKIRNWDSNDDWSPKKYTALLDYLHENNQHYVPIIDAAIGIPDADDPEDEYFAYEKGTELDVWIKDKHGETYIGEVWPGKTVFPDWTHPNTQEWWNACFDKYRQYAPYDGIWCDMNEPASFQEGATREGHSLDDKYDFPKYEIDSGFDQLWQKTVSPSAKLHDGTRHYHQHNLYGHVENIATRNLLLKQSPENRPFIITRSTFAGTGRLSGHWLGDNYSTWASMRNSLQGILQFQMFQIPMVGPDACGFSGNCTEELANRWMQLGAFYPFFRNHNVMDATPQEPFRWESVAAASKKAIEVRYRLLPYWETLFAQASRDGTPPVRTLAWEYDQAKYSDVERQFLIGPSILVTPVLEKGAVDVKGYFPKSGGPWRDWWTGKAVTVDENEQATLDTPLGHINVHIRAGSVLLIHDKAGYTLTETRKGSYGLIVALDEEGKAEGEAVLDDGLSLESDSTDVSFRATSTGLSVTSKGSYNGAPKLSTIVLLGVKVKGGVKVNGKIVESARVKEEDERVVVDLEEGVDVGEVRVEW